MFTLCGFEILIACTTVILSGIILLMLVTSPNPRSKFMLSTYAGIRITGKISGVLLKIVDQASRDGVFQPPCLRHLASPPSP